MNGLSWLLYLAEVSGNVGGLLIACVIGAVTAAIGFGMTGAMMQDVYDHDPDKVALGKALHRKIPVLIVAAFLCGALNAALPSRNTVLMIAASEAGETILSSANGQRITGEAGELAVDSMKLLRKYIDEQLAEDGE